MLNSFHGLDFDLGETTDALRDQVGAFASDEIAPRAAAIDRDNDFPADLWRKFGDLGVLGITAEEEYGGVNMGYLAHCVAMEEISRASASVGLSYGAHSNLCINQTGRNGSAEQKARYLPKLVSGEHVGALATGGGARRPRGGSAAARAGAGAAIRRPRQHPVHQRHHRAAQGRHPHPPEHPQQRLLHRPRPAPDGGRPHLHPPVQLYHCFGMVIGNLACLTHGSAMVYPGEGFDPLATLATVQDERRTALYSVPTMFIAELDHPQFARFDLGSLRTG